MFNPFVKPRCSSSHGRHNWKPVKRIAIRERFRWNTVIQTCASCGARRQMDTQVWRLRGYTPPKSE